MEQSCSSRTWFEVCDNNYAFIADVRNGMVVNLREYNDSAYSNGIFGRNLPPEVSQTFGEMVAEAHND